MLPTKAEKAVMAVTLNKKAFEHAKTLVLEGKVVYNARDDRSEHQHSSQVANEFIRTHGIGEYAKWHLGMDNEKPLDTKEAYEFPYGEFQKVHGCGILSAESRTAQYRHQDIASAVAHVHGRIEAQRDSGVCASGR